MRIIKKIIWGLTLILITLGIVLCVPNNKKSMGPKELEKIYNSDKAVFNDVQNIIDKKREELKFDYIFINDGRSKSENNRIYVYRNNTINKNLMEKSKDIKNLNDIFSKDEIAKLEKVFKYGFIYIEETKEKCSFAEKGLLDCHNEIIFTSKNEGLQKYDEDDEIIKSINNNWYIYAVR